MPITTHKPHIRLNKEKKEALLALIAEAQTRGITLSKDILNRAYIFPKDENGFFIKNDGKHFNANINQDGFLKSRARFVAFIGGRGSGKSSSGAQKALRKIEQGFSGVVANPTFEDLKSSTWLEFRDWIPWDMVVTSQKYRKEPSWELTQPFTMSFINGATVRFKGLNNPNTARGPNINWF
jgi:phage terminase large subunit-like protein